MADVQYIIHVTIPTAADAVVATRVQDVDITPVQEERVRQFTVCNDTTAIFAPGTIRRTIVGELTAEFESRFPTSDNQLRALRNAFKGRFSKMLPARVTESVHVGNYCP